MIRPTQKRLKQKWKKFLVKGYRVQTIYEQNQSLYSVMNMERWIIYGVLCLDTGGSGF